MTGVLEETQGKSVLGGGQHVHRPGWTSGTRRASVALEVMVRARHQP